jgi:hypothetical protein
VNRLVGGWSHPFVRRQAVDPLLPLTVSRCVKTSLWLRVFGGRQAPPVAPPLHRLSCVFPPSPGTDTRDLFPRAAVLALLLPYRYCRLPLPASLCGGHRQVSAEQLSAVIYPLHGDRLTVQACVNYADAPWRCKVSHEVIQRGSRQARQRADHLSISVTSALANWFAASSLVVLRK